MATDFTYGTSKIGKKNLGVFIKKNINQVSSITSFFNTIGTESIAAYTNETLQNVLKALYLDLPIHSSVITNNTLTSAMVTKVIKANVSAANITITHTQLSTMFSTSAQGSCCAFVISTPHSSGTYYLRITDGGGKIVTLRYKGDGIVLVKSAVSGNIIVVDSTFSAFGAALEKPTAKTEKGEDVKLEYGSIVTISENVIGEATTIQVTKANFDAIQAMKLSIVDYSLYEHSSGGKFDSDGFFVSNYSASVDAGTGIILHETLLNPTSVFEGNAMSTITISPSAEKALSGRNFCMLDALFV